MMKTLRALAVCLASVGASALAQAQAVNVAQKITLAGLRAGSGRGSFPAAAYSSDGSLFLLYDQGDGIRVLKLNAAGDTVLAQAQLGSSGDAALALALDPSGNIYITGTSSSGTLNGTSGTAFPSRADTSTNSFLAKFDTSLRTLFVTFLGSGRTAAASVAATADAAFVTGITFGSSLPATGSGIQQAPAAGSSENGFVERFSSAGTLVYATYLTGLNGITAPTAIAADSADNAYVAGSTSSSGFPTIAALVPRIGGVSAGFLAKLTPAGDGFVFSTFVPGTGVTGLALDKSAQTLLLSGNVSFGQFPVSAAPTPLTSATYQSLLRIATDGQSVGASTALVPGTLSFVAKAPNGSAWVTGSLGAPLFPGTSQPLALFGDSFALHVTSSGTVDQTVRLGGQPAGSFSLGSLTSAIGPPAVSTDGVTLALPATITTAVDSSLASATRFDLALVQAPNAALPTPLRELAASCTSAGQCASTAGYLSLLSAAGGTSLSISADNLPNIIVRNLGSTTATGLVLAASGYTVSSTCGSTLPPSTACVAALTGPGPGSFTVSAANVPAQTIALPANTLAPDPLAVLPVELDFGIQTAGSPEATRNLTVTNLSGATQTFASALDSTARSLPYSYTETASDCPTNGVGLKMLAPGASCSITLGFGASPSAASDAAVRSAWKVGTHDIALTGYIQIAALNLSSNVIDFGTYFIGGVRLPRYLYISNNSASAVSHAHVSLLTSSPFTIADECPGVLEPHSVCRIMLNYIAASAPSVDSVTLALDQGLTILVTGQTLPQQGTTGSSANPSLMVSPSATAFTSPVVVSGISASAQTVVLKNTGANAVPLSISLSGDFKVQNGCPSTLAGGSSCQALISFAPSQPGVRQGLLAVTGGSGFAPAYVTLSGTSFGLLPINNGVLDVGKTLVGEPVVVWYKLQQSLSSIAVTSSSPAFAVALAEDDGSGHGTLPASAFMQSVTGSCGNCYLGVRFFSQTTGMQSASLSFITNIKGNPYVLALIGTANPASGLLLTPASQDFGQVAVNSSSASKLFTLANLLAAQGTVSISSVSATGDFTIAANTSGGAPCVGTLAAASSCFVQIIFASSATGPRTGSLTIDTSAGPVIADLSGFGESDPGVAVNPVELDFNAVPGTSATQQTVVVSNTGTSPLVVGAIRTTDASFAASTQCSALAPGATCSVAVTFMPGFAQTSGTLAIPVTRTINGQTISTTYAVLLQGQYTAPDEGLQIVPGEVNFGSIAVGAVSARRDFTLNNLTAKPLTASLAFPRQFPQSDVTACPTLMPYGSCTFSVAYVPAVAGVATGTIFARAVPADGSPSLQTLAYVQGFASGAASLSISGNIIPNAPLMFGQVNSGQSTQQTLTLTDTGTGPVTVRRVSSNPPFLSTTTCGAMLNASQSCTVTLTYAPMNEVVSASITTPARADTGTLTIESDAATGPDVISLTGMAAPLTASTGAPSTLATFTLSQGALRFANTGSGNASPPQAVTLTNTGNVALHVLSAAASTDFSASSDCATLLPGAACSFSITFTPTIASTSTVRTGTLEIRTDASVPLDFVTLIGSTSAAPLTLNPVALDFGTLNVGLRGTLPLTVTNTTASAVTFTGINATGDYTVVSGTCPATGASLAAGASCLLQVTFTPSVPGARTGTLLLSTDATTLPLTVPLTGNAVVARLQVTPGALAFGAIAVNSPASLSLTLLNAGTATLTGIAATLTGPNAADFAVTVPCSTTLLAANQGCNVTVTFTPSAVGPRTATLTIASSDPASPTLIALSGSGSAPGSFILTVDGGSTASRTVARGLPASYTLTVTPLNGFTGMVALTCAPVTPGVYASCSLAPSSVTLNSGPQTSVVTINTITSASNAAHIATDIVLAWLWLPLFCVRRRRGLRQQTLTMLILCPIAGVFLGAALVGCGEGGDSSLRYTPAGTYQYTVTGTSTSGAQITQTVTLNLTVR